MIVNCGLSGPAAGILKKLRMKIEKLRTVGDGVSTSRSQHSTLKTQNFYNAGRRPRHSSFFIPHFLAGRRDAAPYVDRKTQNVSRETSKGNSPAGETSVGLFLGCERERYGLYDKGLSPVYPVRISLRIEMRYSTLSSVSAFSTRAVTPPARIAA